MLNVFIWVIIVFTVVLCGYQVFQVGIEIGNVVLSAMGAGLITFGLLLPVMYRVGKGD